MSDPKAVEVRKEDVSACVDAMFDAAEGRFQQVVVFAAVQLMYDAFRKKGYMGLVRSKPIGMKVEKQTDVEEDGC